MAISRLSVLAGHVAAAMIQTLVAVTVVVAAAVGVGFPSARRRAGRGRVLTMIALALIWLGVALVAAKGLESASNTPMLLMLLPFPPSRAVRSAIVHGPGSCACGRGRSCVRIDAGSWEVSLR